MDGQIMVSIVSLAYNQEQYVRRALDGFVMQKTNFAFEILIHDDASTDRTAEIIREYEAKYPEIMRPVYQTENQYSKGIKPGVALRAAARGKYIATCEADDYWTDPLKLQKQVDYMEAHPECSMCAHALRQVDKNGNALNTVIRPATCDRDFTAEDVILSGGGMFQTNSVLMRRDLANERPDFYLHSTVGDYPMQILMGLHGTIHYIDEFMSVYRVHSTGSWTAATLGSTEKTVKHCRSMCRMLTELAEYAPKYADVCQKRILLFDFYIALLTGDIPTVRKLRRQIGIREPHLTRSMRLGMLFPRLYYKMRARRTEKWKAN